jgi:hypothetical protein
VSVVAAGAAAWLGAAQPARADSGDEHAAAMAIVMQLEHDTWHAAVTAEAVAKAKDALERATRMRVAGDEAHAKAADGVALEWAETGRDLAKAADAEAASADLRKKAVDAQAQLERTRAMVEEGIARVGRLKAQLEEAQKNPRPDRVAVEAHEGDPPKKKDTHGKKVHPVAGEPKPGKTGGAP